MPRLLTSSWIFYKLLCYLFVSLQQDVELLCKLLEGVSFEDAAVISKVSSRFHRDRTAHAATINILANALYQVKDK